MYKQIGGLNLDPKKTFGYDKILVDFDDSQEPMRLKTTFFKGDNYQEETIVTFTATEEGIYTDADNWKNRCLDLAAQLDVKDMEN